jgi:hypothetical protein
MVVDSIKEVHHAFRIPLSEGHACADGGHSGRSDSDDREGHRDRGLAALLQSSTPSIHAEHFTFFPAMAAIFLSACTVAVIGWAVLVALRRSGVHRLSEMPVAPPQN